MNKMDNVKLYIIVLGLFFLSAISAESLSDQAQLKMDELNLLINDLKEAGIDTYKEELAVRTSEVFLEFADWDEANVIINQAYFASFSLYKNEASQLATDLPDFERNDIIKLLDDAISYAVLLKNKEVFRTPTPRVDWSQVSHEDDQLTYEGRPVFLADWTWKPSVDKLTEFYGAKDGYYMSPTDLSDADGNIANWRSEELKDKADGNMGFVFIANNNVPDWTTTEYGTDFTKYIGDPFYLYDVDHPGAQEMMGNLLDATVSDMSGKKYAGLGYMLCNEPRWITYKNGDKKVWYTSGVSDYTMVKFRSWLKEKHGDINTLNSAWKSYYSTFDAVTIAVPVDISNRGNALWYDWNTFNDARVLEWFTWMKVRLRENDPLAKVHLKIMPSFFTDNDPATGIDLEALTELSDINGNDCAAHYNDTREAAADWEEKYILGWRELYMGYDFLKSVQPDQINFNSESHLLSTGHARDLYMNPKYARSVYWAATLLGMDASQSWYWPREADGSISRTLNHSYPGSNNQQARVTNEVHSTIIDLNAFSEDVMAFQRQRKPLRIFYSKTSAHQKAEYMDDVFALYESLNFSGLSLGFATKNIISRQENSDWDAILVYKTARITQAERDALQQYLDNGGRIIMDNESLKLDEYGSSIDPLIASAGALVQVDNLAQLSSSALTLLLTKGSLPKISVTESNGSSTKGCVWRAVVRENGEQALSISNYGKTTATLTIALKNAVKGTQCKDLINGVLIASEVILKPYEVLFVEVSDGDGLTPIVSLESSTMEAVLYPSVCTHSFNIEMSSFRSKVNVKLYSIDGKLQLQKDYYDTQFITENISHLDVGNYFVKISDESLSQTFRFLKTES